MVEFQFQYTETEMTSHKVIYNFIGAPNDKIDKNADAGKFWTSGRVVAFAQLKPVELALAGPTGSSIAVEQMFSISGI